MSSADSIFFQFYNSVHDSCVSLCPSSLSISFQTRPPGSGGSPELCSPAGPGPHSPAGQVHARQAGHLLQQRQLRQVGADQIISFAFPLAYAFVLIHSRYDSGFRDSGQLEQEPHLEKAINSVRFVAQHVKNQDRYNKVGWEKISREIFFGPRPFTVVWIR